MPSSEQADWTADPWVQSHSIVTPEKLHALGYLTLSWNTCEYCSHATLAATLNISYPISRILSHDLGNVRIWAKIVQAAKMKNLPEAVQEELAYASKCYDRCRNNRNSFVHAGLGGSGGEDGSILNLIRTKGHALRGEPLQDDLCTLRRVGEEIESITRYVSGLCLWIELCLNRQRNGKRRTLPDRPPLPEFVWKPPLPEHPKR